MREVGGSNPPGPPFFWSSLLFIMESFESKNSVKQKSESKNFSDETIFLHEIQRWVLSSVAEHGIADPAVTGSNPVVPSPGWCSW